MSHGGYRKYLEKRFWRVYPEMWIAIAVEIIVMCILYRGWNVTDTALFALTQSTIFQFWTPDSLRGYGCGTPNGALWTMCVTIQFYIIAWFIYKILKNQKWWVWVIAIIASIIVNQLCEVAVLSMHIELILNLYYQTVVKYLWLFLLGMWAACFFDKVIPFCRKWWPLFIFMAVLVRTNGFDFVVGYAVVNTTLVFLAIIGFSYQFPKLKPRRDISFGIFIYHMTVVNAMLTFELTGKLAYLLIASAVSLTLGYVSTITIGEYSAKKKVA